MKRRVACLVATTQDLAGLLVAIAAARWTTGHGGVGSEAAKTEQQIIIDLLNSATG
jgi:hypothetical protein